ncbi:MAG: hypothetical protein AAF245_10810 [Pseudomonadota bacterium]
MKLVRRSFLALAGVTILGTAAFGLPLTWRSERDLVESLLRRRLPDLRMDADQIDDFAADFLENYKLKGRARRERILTGARMLQTVPDGVTQVVLPGAINTPLERLEKELFHSFFLGTDFLEVYQDPSETVTYAFIPDPYDVGCSNKLAKFDA